MDYCNPIDRKDKIFEREDTNYCKERIFGKQVSEKNANETPGGCVQQIDIDRRTQQAEAIPRSSSKQNGETNIFSSSSPII